MGSPDSFQQSKKGLFGGLFFWKRTIGNGTTTGNQGARKSQGRWVQSQKFRIAGPGRQERLGDESQCVQGKRQSPRQVRFDEPRIKGKCGGPATPAIVK